MKAKGPLALLLAAAVSLAGCAGRYGGANALGRTSLPEHVVMDLSHPWHSWPAQVVGIPLTTVLAVVTLPLSGIEWAVTGEFPLGETELGVVPSGCAYVGLGTGFLVGLPFFVLALPFGEGPEEDPDDPGLVRDEAPQGTTGAGRE